MTACVLVSHGSILFFLFVTKYWKTLFTLLAVNNICSFMITYRLKFASIGTNNGLEPLFYGHWSKFGKCILLPKKCDKLIIHIIHNSYYIYYNIIYIIIHSYYIYYNIYFWYLLLYFSSHYSWKSFKFNSCYDRSFKVHPI